MSRSLHKLLPVVLGLFLCGLASAQVVHIDTIYIEGNKRTRDRVILRELDFKPGDTIVLHNLTQRLEQNELFLINTFLFNDAKMNIRNWRGDTLDLLIQVREAWYIYPLLIFELADRNFNVWWTEQNRALNRLNLGVRFYFENFTGQNDRLKLVAQAGYTQKYEVEYRIPLFNKQQSIGLSVNALHTRNREVGYQTNDTTIQRDFIRLDNDFSLLRSRAGLKLSYRPKLLFQHDVSLQFHHNRIADTVAYLNPDFFLEGRQLQRYFSLEYRFTLDRRDRRAYALKGNYFQVAVRKDGLGLFNDVNHLSVTATVGQFWQAGKRFSFELSARGRKNILTALQPYYTQRRAMGYDEDFIRGYEFYVIDGQDFAWMKGSVRFQLFDTQLNGKRFIPIKAMKVIPFRMYLKLNNDFGYVNDPFALALEPLSNQLLWGGGVGLDIVIYHSFVFQVEYSINRLREKGVYLHFNVPF